MANFIEPFDHQQIDLPNKVLILGSGLTKTPKEWLNNYPTFRINATTYSYFHPTYKKDNNFGLLTHHASYIQRCGTKQPPLVLVSDKSSRANRGHKLEEGLWRKEGLWRVEEGSGSPYFQLNRILFYKEVKKHVPHAKVDTWSSGAITLAMFLLFSNVETVYISGFDGHRLLPSGIYGEVHDLTREWEGVRNMREVHTQRGNFSYISYDFPENMLDKGEYYENIKGREKKGGKW